MMKPTTLVAEHRKQGKAKRARGAENVRRYRARQRNAGYQRVELLLSRKAVDQLRRLTAPHMTWSKVVAWLILNYR